MSNEFLFKTIKTSSEGLFKDRGSKFIAYAYRVLNEDDFKSAMSEVKEIHPTARHFCYAYRIGLNGEDYRVNDDGEPSGSAGQPILNQLRSLELTNLGVIVVRYFGGTKLGVPGLINAYKEATLEAINENEVIQDELRKEYEIYFQYALMNDIMTLVKKNDLFVLEQKFDVTCYIKLGVPCSFIEHFESFLGDKSGLELKTL